MLGCITVTEMRCYCCYYYYYLLLARVCSVMSSLLNSIPLRIIVIILRFEVNISLRISMMQEDRNTRDRIIKNKGYEDLTYERCILHRIPGACELLLLLLYTRLKGLKSLRRRCKRPTCKRQFSIDNRERGFHARGVYPTQDTSRMGTARVKEEKADAKIIVK